MKNRTRKIIRFVGVMLIIVALGFFGWDYYLTYKSKAISEELSNVNQQILDELPPQDDLSEEEVLQLRLNKLNQEYLTRNEDYIGWINVNGTVIDYPIVQAKDNDFYLRRNFNKERMQHEIGRASCRKECRSRWWTNRE